MKIINHPSCLSHLAEYSKTHIECKKNQSRPKTKKAENAMKEIILKIESGQYFEIKDMSRE